MKTLSLTLFVGFLLCSFASAQSEKNKTCRILFLERPANAPQTLHLYDGVKSQEVELPKMNLSQVYEIAPESVAIALLNNPVEKAEDIPVGTPKISLLPGVVDFYLLIAADPSNHHAPLRMRVVDVGNEKLRDGQTLWFNLTDHTIGGKLGTERILIKPRSQAIMNQPTSANEDYNVKIAYTVEGKNEVYPICETQWTHNPSIRNLAFIFANADKRTPRVWVFPDIRIEKNQKNNEIVTE